MPHDDITGLVLAGGRGQRMGGQDKGLVLFDGRAMIAHVIEALRPQVGPLLINANRSQAQYAAFGLSIVADALDGFLGPLAGIAAGLQAATTPYVTIVPCDSPFIPADLVVRLQRALIVDRADLSVAHDGQRLQTVFTLLKRELLPSLLAYLHAGERRVDGWMARQKMAIVAFDDCPRAFVNINDPETLRTLEPGKPKAGTC
ncbi:MAG: molybdenum cofactor guanylyltransferase [Gammaproteobacteria bacterium]|nr:molybdenum cofactor guanylyltransferase [Gammaproteobacteria bacterium]